MALLSCYRCVLELYQPVRVAYAVVAWLRSYQNRSRFQLLDSAVYFFEQIDRVLERASTRVIFSAHSMHGLFACADVFARLPADR